MKSCLSFTLNWKSKIRLWTRRQIQAAHLPEECTLVVNFGEGCEVRERKILNFLF